MGMSQSDAIRYAIQQSASALHEPKRLAAEMAALEADPIDRAEMLSIAQFMEELRE
jgi:Arc/MetJ-type ribon-helix-helix transcriptional regulator